ncbi:bacterial regulatory helix-turn-helix, lysR family protein, partial [Vibrio parahaemolyticus V-223/04]
GKVTFSTSKTSLPRLLKRPIRYWNVVKKVR